jgi:hypothetical protein
MDAARVGHGQYMAMAMAMASATNSQSLNRWPGYSRLFILRAYKLGVDCNTIITFQASGWIR